MEQLWINPNVNQLFFYTELLSKPYSFVTGLNIISYDSLIRKKSELFDNCGKNNKWGSHAGLDGSKLISHALA